MLLYWNWNQFRSILSTIPNNFAKIRTFLPDALKSRKLLWNLEIHFWIFMNECWIWNLKEYSNAAILTDNAGGVYTQEPYAAFLEEKSNQIATGNTTNSAEHQNHTRCHCTEIPIVKLIQQEAFVISKCFLPNIWWEHFDGNCAKHRCTKATAYEQKIQNGDGIDFGDPEYKHPTNERHWKPNI